MVRCSMLTSLIQGRALRDQNVTPKMASSALKLAQKGKLTAAVRYLAYNCARYHSGHDGSHDELSKREYWQHKYQEPTESFDWFLPDDVVSGLVCYSLFNIASKKNFSKSQDILNTRIEPVNVLDLGCGKSLLPLRFYEWEPFPIGVHCLDYVQEAVEYQLKTLRATWPGHHQSYVFGACASVCNLPYRSEVFNVVMDKGTMDALLKDPKNGTAKAEAMLSEVDRVLQKNGVFVQVTDEDPDSRMYFLETSSPRNCQWRFSILTESGKSTTECFIYTYCKC